jgi:hypothetical protein
LPALTERFPPVVSVVPLKVSVLVALLVVVTFLERKPFLTVRLEALVVSVVVTPVMVTSRPAESDASPPALTLAAVSVRSRPAETTRLPLAAISAPVTAWVVEGKKRRKSQEVDTESVVLFVSASEQNLIRHISGGRGQCDIDGSL